MRLTLFLHVPLAPTPAEKKQGKSTIEVLDTATCGRLLNALKRRIRLPSEAHWKILFSALDDRNYLAHRFLVQFDYDDMTAAKEKKIVRVIYEMVFRLRKAVLIVRALKKSLDEQTNHIDALNEEILKSAGVSLSFPRKKTQG